MGRREFVALLGGLAAWATRREAPDQEMPMSNDLTTVTIDGRVHTHMSNAFADEAEPGRSYITRILNFLETREKDAARGVGLLASAFAKSGW
jgi:hypothetical protein